MDRCQIYLEPAISYVHIYILETGKYCSFKDNQHNGSMSLILLHSTFIQDIKFVYRKEVH